MGNYKYFSKHLKMSEGSSTTKSPKVAPAHPPFETMISSAISSLNEKGGSSRKAILKFLLANNKGLNPDVEKVQNRVRIAIKRMLAAKKLVPASSKSAKGTNGSLKLSPRTDNTKVKKLKKPVAKKFTPKKELAPKKKPVSKQKAALKKKSDPKKKVSPGKNAPKPKKAIKEPIRNVKQPIKKAAKPQKKAAKKAAPKKK